MQFNTLKEEQEFDRYAAEFLLTKRHPSPEDMAKIMLRAYENLGDGLISVAHFERAYRELYASGDVALVTEPLKVETVAKPEALTAEEYRRIPASQVARRYLNDRGFRKSVDILIARREI